MKKSFVCCLMVLSTVGIATANSTYTVKKGDSLSKIAQVTLGSEARWREIAKTNGIRKPYTIRPNQVLNIGITAPAAVAVPSTTEQPAGLTTNWRLEDRMVASPATPTPTAYPAGQQMSDERGVNNTPNTSYPPAGQPMLDQRGTTNTPVTSYPGGR